MATSADLSNLAQQLGAVQAELAAAKAEVADLRKKENKESLFGLVDQRVLSKLEAFKGNDA